MGWIYPWCSEKELSYFEERLGFAINLEETNRLKERLYVSLEDKFTWPDLNNPYNSDKGRCEAIHQIAILSNGNVVPCCLDKDGVMTIGNIFNEKFVDIINNSRYQDMINGFKMRKITEDLCKHCTFLNRFK